LRRARARTTFSLRPARVRLPPRSGFFLSFWFLVFPRLSRGGDIVASRWLLRQQPGSYTCTPLTPTRQRMTRIRFGIGDFTVRQRPEVPVPRFALDNNCLNYVRNVRNGTIAASFYLQVGDEAPRPAALAVQQKRAVRPAGRRTRMKLPAPQDAWDAGKVCSACRTARADYRLPGPVVCLSGCGSPLPPGPSRRCLPGRGS